MKRILMTVLFGVFSGTPFSAEAEEVVVVCKKTGSAKREIAQGDYARTTQDGKVIIYRLIARNEQEVDTLDGDCLIQAIAPKNQATEE